VPGSAEKQRRQADAKLNPLNTRAITKPAGGIIAKILFIEKAKKNV
jgi:hypothetical protein